MINVWKSWELTNFTPIWLNPSPAQGTKADAPVILASSAQYVYASLKQNPTCSFPTEKCIGTSL